MTKNREREREGPQAGAPGRRIELAADLSLVLRTGANSSDGDAADHSISWETAQDEAAKWLGTLKLGRDLYGQTIDLSARGDTLKAEGEFRRMVLEAARRKLVKRQAREIILPL